MEYGGSDWLYDIDSLDEIAKKQYLLIRQITPEMFMDYLSEKGVKMTCQSCGKETLFFPHTIEHDGDYEDDEEYDESKDIKYVTPLPKYEGPFRIHTAKYEVNCSNCGFICHYGVFQVVQWAKGKGVISGDWH